MKIDSLGITVEYTRELLGIFIESFLAQAFRPPISISYNGLGSDTLWVGFGSGREVRPAQCVLMWARQLLKGKKYC